MMVKSAARLATEALSVAAPSMAARPLDRTVRCEGVRAARGLYGGDDRRLVQARPARADHRPLVEAARTGAVVALYVYDSDLIAQPESDPSHYVFLDACLAELEAELAERGTRLTYGHGTMPDVLEALHGELGGFAVLLAHEETGGEVSYARDKRIAAWCRARGVAWREIPQFGVIRPLRARRLGEALGSPDARTAHARTATDRGPRPAPRAAPDARGARVARAREARGEARRHEPRGERTGLVPRDRRCRVADGHVEPVSAWDGCSRPSPYLAFGTIAMREVCQRTLAREAELKSIRAEGATSIRAGRVRSPRFARDCTGTITSCRSWRISRRSSS